MLKTILVALDDSELTEQVVQTLQELQLKSATKVVLLRVIPASDSSEGIAVDRPRADAEEFPYRHIEKQLQAYQAMLPYPSELEIVSGDPAEEIVRLSNIHQADLIVMGNRGLTGVTRILQGSVSSQVIVDAPCSVLVVKPKEE